MQNRNKKERALNRALTPRGPAKCRLMIEQEQVEKSERCALNAWHFLTTGESILPSPYGGDWNREYNPYPYPDAKPVDVEMYMGTGVGLLYRLDGSWEHYWQLAGWNLVRTGSEQRSRRK